ncbi:MAG: hypothetical protein ABJ059_13790, partial [Hyphomicrobiales bacterium]
KRWDHFNDHHDEPRHPRRLQTGPAWHEREGCGSYKRAYESATGESFLLAYGGYAYDTVLFAAEAINRAGLADR